MIILIVLMRLIKKTSSITITILPFSIVESLPFFPLIRKQ